MCVFVFYQLYFDIITYASTWESIRNMNLSTLGYDVILPVLDFDRYGFT